MNEKSNKVLDLFNKDHWFWGAFHQNWWTYGQVILAAFMINFFSLGSSIFIMTVYDRVIPNNAVESLVALCIGMVLLISFDFLLKLSDTWNELMASTKKITSKKPKKAESKPAKKTD